MIGVLEAKGQSAFGQDQDDLILIPLSTAKKKVLGTNRSNPRSVGTISVRVREAGLMGEAEEQIRAILRQRHRLQAGQDDDFQVRVLAEMFAAQEESARVMTMLLAAIASVSLLVGGIGIMNIMLVSVTERTREIGLRMAVGARGRDILAQFLVEAVTLSAVGGLIGVAIGVLVAVVIANLAEWSTDVSVRVGRARVRVRGRGGRVLRLLSRAEGVAARSDRGPPLRVSPALGLELDPVAVRVLDVERVAVPEGSAPLHDIPLDRDAALPEPRREPREVRTPDGEADVVHPG